MWCLIDWVVIMFFQLVNTRLYQLKLKKHAFTNKKCVYLVVCSEGQIGLLLEV